MIDELPPGRKPITTVALSEAKREEVIERIALACEQGRQVYWVCTLIEESMVLQCQTAEDTAVLLKERMPQLNIGLIHGRLKPQEKETIMQAFKAGHYHLLVATTVIEVGVDVPNASLMIIENAERLGLAQLHQLRGRVGRGSTASHCILLYKTPLSAKAKKRLEVMRKTNDGFVIAKEDLNMRGPGEVLGTKQTGDVSFRIADLQRDTDLLEVIHQQAGAFLQQHSEKADRLIQRWLGGREQFKQV